MIGPVFGGWNSPAGDTFKCFRDKPRWGQLRIDTDGNGLLLVKSKTGTDLISAGAITGGDGLLLGSSSTGTDLICAGASISGHGQFQIMSKTGTDLVMAGADASGHGLGADTEGHGNLTVTSSTATGSTAGRKLALTKAHQTHHRGPLYCLSVAVDVGQYRDAHQLLRLWSAEFTKSVDLALPRLV